MSRDYDYLIVGSGIAATLVCDRLLEANPLTSILVLEAGGRIPSRDRRSWWDFVLGRKPPYEKTYDQDDPCEEHQESFSLGSTKWIFNESRVRAYGGSTMHWGGWSLRFKEEDFNCRERTQRGADWPFGYDELEPWYTLAEEVLSVGGDINAEGPPRSGGYPLPPYVWTAHESELASNFHTIRLTPGHMPIARFRRCMTTGTCKYCPIGARYSAQDHMDALLHDRTHRNLEVVINAPVRRIIAGRTRAYGVEHFDPVVEDWKTAHADKVVICAGTYESTKLLLASISPEWPTGIGNRYDQVGRHIVTHLLFSVMGERDINSRMLFQEYDFPTLMSRSWDTEARQCDGKIFVFNNRSLPKMEFEKLMIKGDDRASIVAAAGGTMRAGLSAFIEEFGQPSNRLTIAPGIGKFRLPKTNISFTRYNSTEFNATIDKVRQDLTKCLKSLGYTGVPNDRLEFPRGDHASGTCRMGDRPDKSVTDANLAVHGFDNLFVCSNAVLPNAAAVNPTLTLAALALRLGTHLSERSHC